MKSPLPVFHGERVRVRGGHLLKRVWHQRLSFCSPLGRLR